MKRYISLILTVILILVSVTNVFAGTYKKNDLQVLYDTVATYIFRSEEILDSTLTEDEDALCAKAITIAKAALLVPSFPEEHMDAVYRGLYDAFSMMTLVSQRNNSLTNPKVLRLLKALVSLIANDDYYEIAPEKDCAEVAQTINDSLDYIDNPTAYTPEDMYTQMNKLFIVLRNAVEYKLKNFNAQYGVYVFGDVKEKDWYFSAVNYVFDRGLFNGTSENEFSPSQKMTRAMFITVLARFAGKEDAVTYNFTDASTKEYYSKAVGWAHRNGILTWVEGNLLKPDQPITREEMFTSIYNYIVNSGIDVPGIVPASIEIFSDYDNISDFAKDAIGYACALGIVKGYEDGSIKPLGTATRAEVAQVFINLDKRIGE